MTVSTNINHIFVSGEFSFDSMQRACAALHNLKRSGYTTILVDLSAVTSCFAGSVVPFIFKCRQGREDGLDLALIPPRDLDLAKLFVNSNWLNTFDPTTFPQSTAPYGRHIPALPFTDGESHFRAVDAIVHRLLGLFPNLDRDHFAALEWAINEITDNVLNHASSNIGGVVQLTTKTKSSIIEVVVCDVGFGIPKTLRDSNASIIDDLSALDLSIREGVTRNPVTNMGNGLFGSYSMSRLSGGYFHIYSGYASLDYNGKDGSGLRVRRQSIPYSGTAIICGIGTKDPDLLLKALTFGGKSHVPGYSLLDRIGDADDKIEVLLRKESASFGSREIAREVRTKIENILRSTLKPVTLNMRGVTIVSSSYADEVFGKLAKDMGLGTFRSRVEIVGSNPNVHGVISRAVKQRTET
jgi:hypothetical protein